MMQQQFDAVVLMRMAVMLFALVGLAAAILAPALMGHLILNPIRDLAKRRETAGQTRRIQFMLTDFFWLVIQLNIALGCVVAFVPREIASYFALILGYLAAAVAAMWYVCVHYLSHAGITEARRRAAFILFVVPVTVTAMIATIGLVGGMSVGGAYLAFRRVPGLLSPPALVGLGFLVLIGFALLMCGLVWVLRSTTMWIISGAAPIPGDDESLLVTAETVEEEGTPPSWQALVRRDSTAELDEPRE